LSPLTIVGLDLSLTSTGVAEVYLKDGAAGTESEIKVSSYGTKGKDTATLVERHDRLKLLATRIVNQVIDTKPDLILVESPAFNSRNGHPHDRSGLWWLVVHSLAERRFRVVEVPIQSVKKYATGKGNASKDEILIAMTRRYAAVEFKNNDESDALALAGIGAAHLGHHLVELPKKNLESLDSVRWGEDDG